MSVDTIRVSIPIPLRDVDAFLRAADPVRFFKVDTRANAILWTKVKGLSEANLPSHNANINWDIRTPRPSEVYRMMELQLGKVESRFRTHHDEEGDKVRRLRQSWIDANLDLFEVDELGDVWQDNDVQTQYEYRQVQALDDFQMVDIELSLPKFMRGHNVMLLHDPVPALEFLRQTLEEQIGVAIPPVMEWFVTRLDVCHAYKFPTQELAQLVIDSLKSKKFPYKKPAIHPTSIHFAGKEFSFKIYLKQPEYERHSYRKDRKRLNGEADWCKNYASGVLRIEITCRNNTLKRVTGLNSVILYDQGVDIRVDFTVPVNADPTGISPEPRSTVSTRAILLP